MRRFGPLLFIVAVATAAPASAAPPTVLDQLVATVNEQKILRSDVARRAKMFLLELPADEQKDPKRRERLLRETLDRMIDELLIEADCDDFRIRVTDEEVNKAIEVIGKTYNLDRAGVFAAAEKQGIPRAQYEFELRRRLLDHRWMNVRVQPKVVAPSIGTKEEREEALRTLLAAERRRQLTRLRAEAFIELRW